MRDCIRVMLKSCLLNTSLLVDTCIAVYPRCLCVLAGLPCILMTMMAGSCKGLQINGISAKTRVLYYRQSMTAKSLHPWFCAMAPLPNLVYSSVPDPFIFRFAVSFAEDRDVYGVSINPDLTMKRFRKAWDYRFFLCLEDYRECGNTPALPAMTVCSLGLPAVVYNHGPEHVRFCSC